MRSFFSALMVLGAVGTFIACSSPDQATDDAVSSDQNLQGGTADPNHPSVGLVWFTGGGFCTGTLIAPSVILTAGHCVQDEVDGFYLGQGTPTARISAKPAPGFQKIAVDKWVAHPSYSAGGGCPNTTFDLGLIHTSAPVVGVTPTPIATSPAANNVACDAVGYGTHTENGSDTYEEKRAGTSITLGTDATTVQVKLGTGLADHGDSGGSLICGGKIVGATSCHTDGDWPAHQLEYYARVDSAASWITGQIKSWGGSTDAGADPGVETGSDAGPTACSHASCKAGTKLVSTCDPCVASICATDPYCCNNSWDTGCVGEVNSICHKTCN